MLFISLINQVEIIYSSETHHVQDNKHSGHRVPPQEDTQSDAEKTFSINSAFDILQINIRCHISHKKEFNYRYTTIMVRK